MYTTRIIYVYIYWYLHIMRVQIYILRVRPKSYCETTIKFILYIYIYTLGIHGIIYYNNVITYTRYRIQGDSPTELPPLFFFFNNAIIQNLIFDIFKYPREHHVLEFSQFCVPNKLLGRQYTRTHLFLLKVI